MNEEVPMDAVRTWTICVCLNCAAEIDQTKGGWACKCGRTWQNASAEWIEVCPASALTQAEKERDEARSELEKARRLRTVLANTEDELETASERLEKVREVVRSYDGKVLSVKFALLFDALDRALNETTSEGERCPTCGSDEPGFDGPKHWSRDTDPSNACPDPFHTASEKVSLTDDEIARSTRTAMRLARAIPNETTSEGEGK